MKTTQEEALYNFVFGDEYDEDEYDSKQDAVSDLVEDYDNPRFECDNGEFLVVSEQEAETLAIESVSNLMDDVGVFGLSDMVTEWTIANALDTDWFETAQEETNYAYAQDIKDESSSDDDLYLNRLHEEMVENDIMQDLEFSPKLKESDVMNNIDEFVEQMGEHQGDAVGWYEGEFGTDAIENVAKLNSLIDEQAVAEFVVETDGAAHTLASYDGQENEQDGWMIYKIG